MFLPGIRMYLSTLVLFSLACYLPALSSEGEPPEPVLTLIASALVNPSPPEEEDYHASVTSVMDDCMDWEEITRQALGQEWEKTGEKKRKDLVAVCRTLIMSTRFRQSAASSAPMRVVSKAWAKKRHGALAKATLVLARSSQMFLITYRLHQEGRAWRIVDILLPGTSLVEHCRAHFRTLRMIT
jgi:ABC-type transporter MlaC component